jgi:hypothetical protein
MRSFIICTLRQILSSEMRWARHEAYMEKLRREFYQKDLKEKRPLGRPSFRYMDNIKVDLREMGF